jgi:hypothetical protein
MPITISESDELILVEAGPGFNSWEVLEGVFKASPRHGMPEKNQVWSVREGAASMNFDDLLQLYSHILGNYPKPSKQRKIAIVTEPGFVSIIVDTFLAMAKQLPCELRKFSGFEEARSWAAV